MLPYTYGEWTLILAAYAYEVEDKPLMADATFDILCTYHDATTSNIPEFSPGTGMWVHDALADVDKTFVAAAIAKLRKIGSGASITHINFPDGYLSCEPDNPGKFDYLKP